MQQVSDRLDKLISQIREIQRPHMNGGEAGNVLLVRSLLSLPYRQTLRLISKARNLQVAHGLVLRCFVKRWIRYSVDSRLPMMLAPGAVAVLRYVSFKIMPTKPSQTISFR